MPKKKADIDFPFYIYLGAFLKQERKRIYSVYTPLTKKFLNFNDPENHTAYLRPPQFEALEMYVFLKEYCNNKHLSEIFENWFNKQNEFVGRLEVGSDKLGQGSLFGPFEGRAVEDKKLFREVFTQIETYKKSYSNYIFALTMGLGKTVLMATSIFYEFLLANKYPKDPRFCHNALVFAPDKTVLQSLKEIQTFDKSKVIPPEYVSWLETHLKFHFLDDAGLALNAIDNSTYNIVISNTQKIILKKQHREKSPSELLFADTSTAYRASELNKGFEDLYGFEIETEQELATNQRFAKLSRLKQLGIYVDEAHHVFGSTLADDLLNTKKTTSLRLTIDFLASDLEKAGTHVVGCFNYTGTPYVGTRILPEVVYAYGLRESIDNKYLKKVKISGFENIKDQTLSFVRICIIEFWNKYGTKRYEDLLPKIAFFASTIEELQNDLKPAVEQVLTELNIRLSKVLINVGDATITNNDDLREFKNLDTPRSEKQFILLVNKGKEGWNCRSLFAIGLHRQPKSKIFVLQATMRCLRSIGTTQETGLVFLSEDNINILNSELEQNFRLSVNELNISVDNDLEVEVRPVPPPVKVKLKRLHKLHRLQEKDILTSIDFEFEKSERDRYRIFRSERSINDLTKKIGPNIDITAIKEKRQFSEITLIAEIARYLNKSPIQLRKIVALSKQGIDNVLNEVNEFNELLYDWIIPKLFHYYYDIIEYESKEEIEIELVKTPKEGCYRLKANKDLIASISDEAYEHYKIKSFHLDNYCFDSHPENKLFIHLLKDSKVDKVWFTGMLTNGQSDFVIPYIDHDSHTLRSYYPDFLVQLHDGSYIILEVKADNKIDDLVVKSKEEYASQMASASQMTYRLIPSSTIMSNKFTL